MSALKQVITWLEEGKAVVLYSTIRSRTFYMETMVPETVQVIYTEVDDSLLDDGEWEWYIKSAGHKETGLGFMPSNVQNYKLK